jgi:hypothetical protein
MGKMLEEFFASNQLHIINEDSTKTFHSSRASSNIDLTIVNNQMLAAIKDWEFSEKESCSDNNIKFNLIFTTNNKEQNTYFQERGT